MLLQEQQITKQNCWSMWTGWKISNFKNHFQIKFSI